MKRSVCLLVSLVLALAILASFIPASPAAASAPQAPLGQANPYIIVTRLATGTPDFDDLDTDALNNLVRTNDTLS